MTTPCATSVALIPVDHKRAALLHVITCVLGFAEDSPFAEAVALDGITNLVGLVTLSEGDIPYVEARSRPLNDHERLVLVMFVRWRRYLSVERGQIHSPDMWRGKTMGDFKEFCASVIADTPDPYHKAAITRILSTPEEIVETGRFGNLTYPSTYVPPTTKPTNVLLYAPPSGTDVIF